MKIHAEVGNSLMQMGNILFHSEYCMLIDFLNILFLSMTIYHFKIVISDCVLYLLIESQQMDLSFIELIFMDF